MWESIILTLAATAGNNIGKVLQKKGTLILPPLSFKLKGKIGYTALNHVFWGSWLYAFTCLSFDVLLRLVDFTRNFVIDQDFWNIRELFLWKVIKAYAFNKPWALGFLMDIFGAILMLRALSLAPVSVIQPVSGCGLAILSVFSHFYLKELMNVVDWVGIVLAGIGTIGIGAGGEEQEASSIPVFRLPWLGIAVAILFVLLNAILRIYRRQRRQQELMQSEVVEEIIYGLESGILFGMASVVSKLGFVLWEQGFSKILIPTSILISVSCSATGFFYQTRGLKHGRAVVVSTCAAIASILTGVLAGMFALGEHLPSAPGARLFVLLGWLCIIAGVILLVSSSRLVRHLPWRHKRSRVGADKRAGNSIRGRDPNPSAVIHTTTLHSLLASPSKEKP